MNTKKLITICTLPIMWIMYTLFELFSGRINDTNTLILNIAIIIIFSFCGLIIYNIGIRFEQGLPYKSILWIFIFFMLIDQGIKIIIKLLFFKDYFEIIPNLLCFSPIINTNGSWLNARFGTSVSFSLLILLNLIAVFLFIEIYRYYLYNKHKSFWADMCFVFIFAGALCSLIDKIFYGGSLDFIGISNLFIADIKDIYINLGILFFIVTIFDSGYLKSDNDTSMKEDFYEFKKFLKFIKSDLLGKHKIFK